MRAGAIASVLTTAFVLSACGDTSGPPTGLVGQTSESETYYVPAPSQVAAAPPSFEPANSWTFSGKSAEGGTGDVTLDAGQLVTGADVNTATDSVLGAACQVDPQTDAVVPFSVRMTSTTGGGFDVQAGYQFLLTGATHDRGSAPLANYQPAEFAVARSEGCLEGVPSMTLGGFATLAPGDGSFDSGLMVLRGWASPNRPDGNPDLLSDIWVGVPSTAVLTGGTWVNEVANGPALLDFRDTRPDRRVVLTPGSTLPD